MSLVKRITTIAAALLLMALTATPANNAEQVIFSKTGGLMTVTGNSNNVTSTPFGFWIWCAAQAAPGSNGGYQNANACQGNMYFYGLNTSAKPIVGFVVETSVGTYTMHVAQGTFAQLKDSGFTFPPPGSEFSCTLNNPSAPPTDTVNVACTFSADFGGGGAGAGTETGAIVNVTGPPTP